MYIHVCPNIQDAVVPRLMSNIRVHDKSCRLHCSCADYVPEGGSRSFPCLPDDVKRSKSPDVNGPFTLITSAKFVDMLWYDEQDVEIGGKTADRVHVNPGKNLTIKDARPENTGRYRCVAKADVADDRVVTVDNVLRINGQHQP